MSTAVNLSVGVPSSVSASRMLEEAGESGVKLLSLSEMSATEVSTPLESKEATYSSSISLKK